MHRELPFDMFACLLLPNRVHRLWTPPDGIVDVANDVLGVLEKFATGGGAPSKPQADLEPAMPDQIINITDVMHALGAFGGQEYDFPVPDPCP